MNGSKPSKSSISANASNRVVPVTAITFRVCPRGVQSLRFCHPRRYSSDNGKQIALDVKVGDRVLFGKYADWRPFKIEGYLFIALIYFAFCFTMSRYSRWVEAQFNKSKLR